MTLEQLFEGFMFGWVFAGDFYPWFYYAEWMPEHYDELGI
jgi:hypothetical protein